MDELVAGKTVKAVQIDKDRYGRVVAQIYVDGVWANLAMVRQGQAWVYPRYAKSKELYKAQEQAQQEGLGLWKLPESERVPPWEWRKSQ